MSSMYGTGGNVSTATGGGNQLPKGYKAGRMQNFTPEMMQLFQQLFGHVGPDSFLSKIASGDEGAFADIERPALQQFTGEMGNLASRFSGMGMGARHGSGFQHEATGAASDFANKLQAQRHGLQREATSDLFNMSQMLLNQKPYENFLTKKDRKPSFLEQIYSMFGPGKVAGQDISEILKLAAMFM